MMGPGQLYAIRLDGTGERLFASDLIPYWMYEMPMRAFAFSATGSYVVYNDDGMTGIRACDLSQGKTTDLAGAYDTLSPVYDQVALVDTRSDRTRYRIRLVALDTGRELWSYASDGNIGTVSFVPDGRGVVFLSSSASGSQQLRFISPTSLDSVLLAEWTSSILETQPGPVFQPYGAYPLDPTGCFTIADTNLSPGPGTRLLLLPQ
jgi:hypothetical protein